MASEPGNGRLPDDAKTLTIRVFSSHESAELAAASLEAHGIECWVNADDCGGMYPSLAITGGVRLQVRSADAEAATVLLDTPASPAEISQIETEAVASPPPETVPLIKPAFVQILLGIVLGVMLCLLYQWANQLGTKTYYYYTADGKRNEAAVYRNGHRVEFMQDRNLDGNWDYWVYYEHGHVVRTEWDNNFDGKPDEIMTFANGLPVTAEKDTDFNGIPDEFCTYQDGVLQQVDFRPNGAKFATQRWLYHNGVLVEILRGSDGEGHFKEAVRYDPFFNPISTNTVTGGNNGVIPVRPFSSP
jgi:hypothetical protein